MTTAIARQRHAKRLDPLGIYALRFPRVWVALVDPILAILSPLPFPAFLKFLALLAAVTHSSTPFQCKRPRESR